MDHGILLRILSLCRKVLVVTHLRQNFISIFFHFSHCGEGIIISLWSGNFHCLDGYELEDFFNFTSHLDILLCDFFANFSIMLSASLLMLMICRISKDILHMSYMWIYVLQVYSSVLCLAEQNLPL